MALDARSTRDSAEKAFVKAAAWGELNVVTTLWNDGSVTNVDCHGDDGWTALLAAANQEAVAIAEFLLERGASTESRTPYSLTPLHLVAGRGNAEMIELLCRFGADVNARGPLGKTALHLTVDMNVAHVAPCLLALGASTDAVDENGETAFMYACSSGREDFVVLVVETVEAARDVDAKRALLDTPHVMGTVRPLSMAANRGDVSVVSFLVHHGAELDATDANGHSPLMRAAINGHEDVVQFLLASGADTEISGVGGRTPLVQASITGFRRIVDMLLAHGAKIDHRDKTGRSSLHAAAVGGHTATIQLLLTSGADSSTRQNEGRAPLLEAAGNGHLDVVQILIDSGADVNCESDDHWTPLAAAAQHGHTAICVLLLQRGASTARRTHQSLTPLHLAAGTGNVDLAELLCQFGADVDARGFHGATPFHIAQQGHSTNVASCLLDHGATPDAVNDHGNTALLQACLTGDEEFVVYVVESMDKAGKRDVKRALVNRQGQHSTTPLIEASYRGSLSLVMFLVHHGANLESNDAAGRSPLDRATTKGHADIVKFLLVSGADTETTSLAGWRPLGIATSKGFGAIVDILLDHGANADHREVNGTSALHVAALTGHTAIVNSLLKHGANPEIRQNEGETPLLAAAQNGHLEIVRLLIDKGGAGSNCQSDDHRTPLILAARKGHTAICALLLERGALSALQTTDGETALHAAASSGHHEIIGLLLRSGADNNARDSKGHTAAVIALMGGYLAIAELLDTMEGAAGTVSDEQVWFRSCLRELYEPDSTGQHEACSPRQNPPWYIDRSSITSIEPNPRLTTVFARVSDGTWMDSRVVIVEPIITDAQQPGLEKRDMKRAFIGEVNRLYPLRHPHVIKLYGACHRGDGPFLVMENPQNGTLRSHIAENKHRTWAILHEVALGVQYLHERGIVHGSLRGDSILIGDDGLVKLSSMGLYSLSLALIDVSTLFLWAAPEVVAQYTNPTSSSDIYSLGMCIVEAVSGESPYAVEISEKQDVKKLITGAAPPKKPAAFNTRQWDLVMQMIVFYVHRRCKISDVVRELAVLAREEELDRTTLAIAPESAASRGDTINDEEEAFALAFSLLDEDQTITDNCRAETPQHQVARRLREAWQASVNLSPSSLVIPRLHTILTRFTNDLLAQARLSRAASFATQRQHNDRVFSFHNEIDRLLDVDPNLIGTFTTSMAADRSSWRERWYEYRRVQLLAFGTSLELANELDFETATCLLFELTKRRDAYSSIPPHDIATACSTLQSMPGVHLPDWFIPHYEVTFDEYQSFNKGAFGSVHHGEWMGSRAVIKKVFADDSIEFEKEVELWSQLYHPHVVQLFGACHVGQKILVAKFAAHGQLDHYLRGLAKQPAKRRREVWRTLRETALGLQYLHSRGIVHCDLKCNNILIGLDCKAKVSDFGLSRKQINTIEPGANRSEDTDHSAPGKKPTEVGAPRWKAPEVLNGADPTVESDIYSFGMCVVEAVTGEYPWGMTLLDGVVSDHVRGGGALFAKPRDFSDAQWAVVVGACRFDPAERTSLAEMVVQLEELANGASEREGDDATVSELDSVAEPEPEGSETSAANTSYSDSW